MLSPFGKPIWDFLFDPPIPVPAGLDIPNRGVLILERPNGSGVFDVYDHVGGKHYPNVADFVEEVRRYGLSRRIKPGPDLNKLSLESRTYLVHDRAIITNAHEYYRALAWLGSAWKCRCDKDEHANILKLEKMGKSAPCCVSLWWYDLIRVDPIHPNSKLMVRTVGNFKYKGMRCPENVAPNYAPGIFLSLPVHRFDVIRDPEGGKDEKVMEQLGGVNLPIRMEDE